MQLHGASGGVVLVGAVVYPHGLGGVGTERGFPPTAPGTTMTPAVGAVVPARTTVDLVVGLRLTRPGGARVHGVDVLYRERWHGVDVRRRTHTGIEVDACATAARARADCPLPNPD